MSQRPKVGELWQIENWNGFIEANRTVQQTVLIISEKKLDHIRVAADLEMYECLLDNGKIKSLAQWHFNAGKRIDNDFN